MDFFNVQPFPTTFKAPGPQQWLEGSRKKGKSHEPLTGMLSSRNTVVSQSAIAYRKIPFHK
jgi:hypothetical protein